MRNGEAQRITWREREYPAEICGRVELLIEKIKSKRPSFSSEGQQNFEKIVSPESKKLAEIGPQKTTDRIVFVPMISIGTAEKIAEKHFPGVIIIRRDKNKPVLPIYSDADAGKYLFMIIEMLDLAPQPRAIRGF